MKNIAKLVMVILFFLLIPTVLSVVSEEMYSDCTTTPSFFCPNDVIRCEMYETVDGLNRNITPPLFIKTCQSSTVCRYVNHVGGSLGFRFLPGDVSTAAGLFKGYKIIDGEYTTTTTTTTTATTTTTINSCLSSGYSCSSGSECCSGRCLEKRTCKNPSIIGVCSFTQIVRKCM
jgi:hypothetical protein